MSPLQSAATFVRSSKSVLRSLLAVLIMGGAVLAGLSGAAPAFAEAPSWRIASEAAPSNLPPGEEGEIIIGVANLGDGEVDGKANPVSVTDTLPAGMTALSISAVPVAPGKREEPVACSPPPAKVFTCTYSGPLAPYGELKVTVVVQVEEAEGTETELLNAVKVEGGGAPAASSVEPVKVSNEPVSSGAQRYEVLPQNENGAPDTQAGSHPFQLTTTLAFNQIRESGHSRSIRRPAALPKDLSFILPPGFIGNPSAVGACTAANFAATVGTVGNLCPASAAIGVALLTINEPKTEQGKTLMAPVFNLVPAQGEPARFGFDVFSVPIVLEASVRTGGGYNVVASIRDASELAGVLGSQVTLWGVPGDPRHDNARGFECIDDGAHAEEAGRSCPTSSEESQQPFLTLPTSCAPNPGEEPLIFSMEANSWAQPEDFASSSYLWSGPLGEPLGLEGCGQLPFSPSIAASPEAHSASTPTGLSVDVKLPQSTTLEPSPEGRAEADVRETTVTLPEGMQLNPSAANGLQACPETSEGGFEGIGFTGFEKSSAAEEAPGTATFTPSFRFTEEEVEGRKLPPSCPEAAKVGIVHIKTPLLPRELEGAVYLATPAPNGEGGKNPFNSLVALYIVAEDREAGVLVKLAGEGRLEGPTGRISTTFRNTPQLPFEELKLELFGGERAPLATPSSCGSYAATASFAAWSGASSELVSEPPFAIDSGPNGGPCPSSPLAFGPGFDAQSTNPAAGAFTPFVLEIARPDGDQALTGVTVHLPEGVAALLSSVTPCQEPAVGQEWACGEASLIGHSTAWSGLGGEPVELGGDAYLTTGYDGAPFGLLVRTHAQAGPFDLGYVNVRSRIDVNPETAAVTITTDPGPHGDVLPSMLKGIPAQLKRLLVTVDRPNFEFNPTSCNPMRISGTLTGSEGAGAGVSSPFQVSGCQSLPFAPKLTASAGGHGSKVDGTSLDVTVTSAGVGQANIAKVDLQLPAALPSRLTTLQKACPEAAFNANPAGCDPESVIGKATIHTPVLNSPLTGPAYLVSHGGAEFPDVEFVLQGEGVKIVLDGKTDIKSGITYSKFESAPDAPFTRFETELPAGPYSVLTPNVPEKEDFSLCKASLAMPTTIIAQDGAVIEQDTNIAVSGCSGVLPSKVVKLTRTQLLAKALKTCKKKYKKREAKRLVCERQAQKRYTAKKAAKKAARRRG